MNIVSKRLKRPIVDAFGMDHARQHLVSNVFSNAFYTVASIIVNFFLTPFLIAHLGIAAYGMIPLVTTVTAYMAVFTTALDTSVSRFLTIDLEKGNHAVANQTFNAAFWGILAILLVLCLVTLLIAALFPVLFQVPAGTETDVRWLLITVAFGFFVSVVGGVFAVSPFVFSQFLWINGANTLGLLIRVAVTVGLFLLLPARLWYFGGGTLIGALIPLALFIVMWRRLTPQLSIQLQAFDRKRLFVLLGMGGWVIVNTAGAMLLSRVDLIVVNAFFGAALTGAYGSVAQLSTLMDSVVNAISSVLRPVMLIKFSQGDIEGLKRVSMISVKLLGFALALPAGLLCGFAKPVLTLWLGPAFKELSLLVIVLVFHFSINYSVRPLLYVQNAYNKVRWPGIATFIAGILDLILAILIARWGKWGYIGIAAVGVLVWTLKNTVYMPLYTAHIMRCPWWTFYPSLLPSLFCTAFVGLTSYGLTLVHSPEHFLVLFGDMLLISLLYGGLVWRFGLKTEERSMVMEVTPLKFLNAQK